MRQVALSLPFVWQVVTRVREEVDGCLAHYAKALRVACAMTASELVENAVKYGEPVAALSSGAFGLWVDDATLRIEVSNGAVDESRLRRLEERLGEIAAATDKEALYVCRLQALLADPTQHGGLGLYRIAFEGRFDLRFTWVDQVVTVTATRRIHGADQ